jgi:leader peptidase (prepilin peptidase)/N-methyltransferase
MDWNAYLPVIFFAAAVFVLGLIVGSFLNVLIARLPYEKSIVWPSSRCFSCFQPIGWSDNIPILGYLFLGGKCRTCQTPYSSRYLWVELGTGLAFVGLFVLEIVLNCHNIKTFNRPAKEPLDYVLWTWPCWVFFGLHAFLLAALIACAVIDYEHRIIPPLIPYAGVVVGIASGAFLPWPWPNPASVAYAINGERYWYMMETLGGVPQGMQPWPFWGPTPGFAPPGSVRMGLLTGVIGALGGSLVVRLIKWLFEVGFGREAMGLGDADLLMMAGAFLGWQVAVLSLFVGAVAALVLKLVGFVLVGSAAKEPAGTPPAAPAGGENSRELPFGPGLAIGVVATWLGWSWLGPRVQFVFFDMVAFGISATVMAVGMVAAGLLLRRPDETAAEAAK